METLENYNKYHALRKAYPLFIYESFHLSKQKDGLKLDFVFSAGEKHVFRPQMFFPAEQHLMEAVPGPVLYSLAFHIGMVEMVSYWKAFCSPRILVKPFALDKVQQDWWKKLFIHGLGEFFYTNGIPEPGKEILDFEFDEKAEKLPPVFELPKTADRVLIPVGGGKDSAVTLELLKKHHLQNMALVVNHRGATRQVLEVAGFEPRRIVEVKRSLDPLLLDLNKLGFLNGHTPFSALLAFVSLFYSCLAGLRHIALSNESSANEPSIPGTKINHQYSKSFEFEKDFRTYVQAHICKNSNYFSFLRPLNELQIGSLFSGMKPYHGVFKSCNAGSKTDSWCCRCSKCLFTWIMLSPFLQQEEMQGIFGADLFANGDLLGLLDQLTGTAAIKPFECVGTLDEVNAALVETINKRSGQKQSLPKLLEHYPNQEVYKKYKDVDFAALLKRFEKPHFLEESFVSLLQEALKL